jgi:hypothetical protein
MARSEASVASRRIKDPRGLHLVARACRMSRSLIKRLNLLNTCVFRYNLSIAALSRHENSRRQMIWRSFREIRREGQVLFSYCCSFSPRGELGDLEARDLANFACSLRSWKASLAL